MVGLFATDYRKLVEDDTGVVYKARDLNALFTRNGKEARNEAVKRTRQSPM